MTSTQLPALQQEQKTEVVHQSTALPERTAADLYKEEMGIGGQVVGLQFERIKVPSGGGIAWQVPGPNPEQPQVLQELVGVVVDDHFLSALWLTDYSGERNAPDATWFEVAPNNIVATINDRARQAGALDDLEVDPFNQWGSDGKGKAAKQMYRLYVLRDGDVLPLMLTIPPSSMKAWTDFKRYVLTTLHKLIPEVAVKFTLKQAVNDGGIPYSTVQFSVAEQLAPDLAQEMLARREQLRQITRTVPVAADEAAPQTQQARPQADEVPFG